MRVIILYALIFIYGNLLSSPVFADQTQGHLRPIEISYMRQVQIDVASNKVNRINFDNFRVIKLIGNISSFTGILSDQGSDLFIAPKIPPGNRVEFSAMLSSGDIIDFSLNVVKGETPSLVKLKFSGNKNVKGKSEALQMIEAMCIGKTDKYYVQNSVYKIEIPPLPEVKATAVSSYRFGNLRGIVLILENTDRRKALEVTADKLAASFAKVVAIHVRESLLPAKGKMRVYMVFKEPEV